MPLSAGNDYNQTRSRLLNKLIYATTDVAADLTTAATSDILLMFDASDNYEAKYADSTNVFELMGLTSSASELNTMTGVLATTAEINRACDASTRVVSLAVTTVITELLHDGKLLVMDGAGGARTFTLPASTGSGGKYRFIVGAVNTSGYLIKAAAGADHFNGTVLSESSTDSTTDAVNSWTAGSTDDTFTFDGTTTGGVKIGDWVEFCDIKTNTWAVTGVFTQSGTEATPFSDTVA